MFRDELQGALTFHATVLEAEGIKKKPPKFFEKRPEGCSSSRRIGPFLSFKLAYLLPMTS
jgi:hypothetical protein